MADLNPHLIRKLASMLMGTTASVNDVAFTVFGVQGDTHLIEQLRRMAEVFQCEHCQLWKMVREEDADGVCDTCGNYLENQE